MGHFLDGYSVPPERADSISIAQDTQLLMQHALLDHLTRIIPCVLIVLNQQRQVVFNNQRMLDIFGSSMEKAMPGGRFGEIVNCVHARSSPGGCGTTEFCRECGLARAVLQSQTEARMIEAECSVSTVEGDAYEFRARATPFRIEGRDFTIVSLLDIRDEKRRQSLERTFFHDIGNILSAITGYAQLIEGSTDLERSLQLVEGIQAACHHLVDSITSHQRLLQAENGELETDLFDLSSLTLIDDVVKTFTGTGNWRNRSIVVETGSEMFKIKTDRALLSRVLINMVTNAFEAADEKETVRIACERDADSGIFRVQNPNVIPRAVQLRIFKRSFSTKGRGRGIGTYSMKLFGEKYLKGKVWFSTSEAEGSTFYISVPLEYPKA